MAFPLHWLRELLDQRGPYRPKAIDDLDHVDGNPDRAGLVGHGTAEGLADPPGGVGRELVALGVVELLDRADQAGVALLDQVEHRHAGAHVATGDRDDQAQVGPDEQVLRLLALGDQTFQFLPADAAPDLASVEEVLGVEARLDGLGEFDLPGSVQQRRPGDLVQVDSDEVALLGYLVGPHHGALLHVAHGPLIAIT